MSPLPQELVEAVVAELDDVESLKACSLAGSQFRHGSQRILLHSLTLKTPLESVTPNYDAACTFLSEAPHVAGYITLLRIQLPVRVPTSADVEKLQQVLDRLANVRHCIIVGPSRRLRGSLGALSPAGTSVVFDFFSRQRLRGLCLRFISEIPTAAFRQLVTAAPMLSLCLVSIQDGNNIPGPFSPAVPLDTLVLDYAAQNVCAQLVHPEFRSCIVSLRRLSIPIHYEYREDIMLAAANTLQYLHFCCKVYTTKFDVLLPQLPKVHSIEFAGVYHSGVPQWINILSRFLVSTSSPALGEITLTLFPIRSASPHAVDASLLSPLDLAIMAHPGAPRIRWRTSFAAAVQTQFDEFVLAVQGGMPRAHAASRLVVESYDDRQDYRADFFPDIWSVIPPIIHTLRPVYICARVKLIWLISATALCRNLGVLSSLFELAVGTLRPILLYESFYLSLYAPARWIQRQYYPCSYKSLKGPRRRRTFEPVYARDVSDASVGRGAIGCNPDALEEGPAASPQRENAHLVSFWLFGLRLELKEI
ncbi:hypothetical protein FB451DRAFT_1450572 [Mycena latifolia]|nr:hypothetical protein FB451DRAFT_1450572 [Mycena latifolia]